MEERHLSLSDVARVMGVSERTARRWIKSGKLRAYKPGRDYKIPESALREFIEESEVRPKVALPLQLDLAAAGEGLEELGRINVASWEEELRRWEEKFPADERPTPFGYGTLLGWIYTVVRDIRRYTTIVRRDPDLAQRAEMADVLGRMEVVEEAMRSLLKRVSGSKTDAEFQEILEANGLDATISETENR